MLVEGIDSWLSQLLFKEPILPPLSFHLRQPLLSLLTSLLDQVFSLFFTFTVYNLLEDDLFSNSLTSSDVLISLNF